LTKLVLFLRAHQTDASILLFLAAGAIGIASQVMLPVMPGAEMLQIAQNLAAHGTFANPFWTLATGPTAVNPPLYPLLLAALFKILRQPAYVYFASTLLAILANAFTASLLPRLSVALLGDCVPGIFAGLLWLGAMQSIPGWDTNLSIVGILISCLMTLPSGFTQHRPIPAAILGGILAGLLFLLNPSLILLTVPWLVYIWLTSQASKLSALRYPLIILGILCLFWFGWAFRNLNQLGAFVVRTGFGMTFYASNNDCAQSSMIRDQFNNCFQTHHPYVSVDEAKALFSLGEVRYDRLRTADALAWIRTHPARFTRLTLRRFLEFWFPAADWIPPTKIFQNGFSIPDYTQKWSLQQRRIAYVIWLATALSVPGLILMVRRRERVTLYFIAVLALYPLMYYLVITDVRYRYPVLWITLLCAGSFLRDMLESDRMPAASA
jgi:hypothetical protein